MTTSKKWIRPLVCIVAILLLAVLGKKAWIGHAMRGIGAFETERDDILARRDFLLDKMLGGPERLLTEMPSGIGAQFQGEWALYSCSMLSAALVNIARLYPDTAEEAAPAVEFLIRMVMSRDLRRYDALRWGEDPLETLGGDRSHISYLSHLAWMIGGYRRIGGDDRYDELYDALCRTMDRRIRNSPTLNLPTYPGEYIYVPDMLVAIAALADYADTHRGKYRTTVDRWLEEMKTRRTDPDTGLLLSVIPDGEDGMDPLPVKGSYSALNCYYLTRIDRDFAREQYDLLKEHFLQTRPVAGIREYRDRRCLVGMDIDAGPILLNLSPSGTAFAVGSATFFDDREVRTRLMKTAETAGFTVERKGKRHYKLADLALVGEAIMLAMRTAAPEYQR